MNKSKKAQISLVISAVKYGITVFILIFILLLIFFSISQVTEASLKSRSYGLNLFDFVNPMLIILPSLLSIAIPYAFLITFFLVIRKLRQRNFFHFLAIYPFSKKNIIYTGFIFSFSLALVIFSLQDNLLNKFDKYIENTIRNIKSRPLASVVEPLKFNRFDDFVLYLPHDPKSRLADQKVLGHAYKLTNEKLSFIGRGYLNSNNQGDVFLENVNGYELNSRGFIKKEINESNIILLKNRINKKIIKRYAAYYKTIISSPTIPLTPRAQKNSYPYKGRLEKIKNLQSLLFISSPVVFYLFILVSFYLLGNIMLPSGNFINLVIPFFWCGMYLVFPMFTEVNYYTKPSYFWYWFILISGVLILSNLAWSNIRLKFQN